jgi:short-subunit dehydrogenase
VALITGASRGFGRATATLLAGEGADVVLNYRAAGAEATAVCEQSRALGRQAVTIQADVSQPDQAARLGQQTLDAMGRVDVLINNAGIMDVRPFAEQELPTWRAMIDTNVYGVLALTHAVLPSMIERGAGGRIICLASQLGHVGGEKFAVYSGTKAFLLAFTKSLARRSGRMASRSMPSARARSSRT